jgi:hypothetical protein
MTKSVLPTYCKIIIINCFFTWLKWSSPYHIPFWYVDWDCKLQDHGLNVLTSLPCCMNSRCMNRYEWGPLSTGRTHVTTSLLLEACPHQLDWILFNLYLMSYINEKLISSVLLVRLLHLIKQSFACEIATNAHCNCMAKYIEMWNYRPRKLKTYPYL